MVLANPFNFVTLRNAIESRGASEHQYGSISSDDYTNTHIHTHTHTHIHIHSYTHTTSSDDYTHTHPPTHTHKHTHTIYYQMIIHTHIMITHTHQVTIRSSTKQCFDPT